MHILIDQDNLARLTAVASLNTAAHGQGWICPLYNADNAVLVSAPMPSPWQPGCWRWNATTEDWEMAAVPEGYAAWAHERIDAQRKARIAAGMPYDFPDGRGTVQLRNETDILNVTGVGTSGLMLVVAGDTETRLSFRDEADVTHTMTGAEAQAFGLGVSAWISAHYARAWELKTEVNEALALAEESGDCSLVEAVDFTVGWPEATGTNE